MADQPHAPNSTIRVQGMVVGPYAGHRWRVQLGNGEHRVAGLSSEMRMSFTRVLPGEKVLLEFAPYDLSQGRIIGHVKGK
jgi:translation initiation factor IF-1